MEHHTACGTMSNAAHPPAPAVWDAVVVGGGPAGAWAAYGLARRGARVALVDGSHPREKPCGGGITGRALELVGPAIGPLDGVVVESAAFGRETRARARVRLPAHGVGAASALVVASRRDFDLALWEAARTAGAEPVPQRALDVRIDGRAAEVRTQDHVLRAPIVIGADGPNSLVRRRLSRPFRRAQFSIATGFFVRGVSSREAVLDLVSDPPGYIWSFPRPDHLAIGICAQADVGGAAALRRTVRAWIGALDPGIPDRALEAYSWPIPSLGAADLLADRPAGPRWLLVGDAAGLVDPLTREGIYFALRSAELAAEAVTSEAPAPDNAYLAALSRDVTSELVRAARLKHGFFRPAFIEQFVRALDESPRVRQVMVDLIAGRQGYADLKLRLLKTFEVGLACRMLVLALRGRMAA